LGRVFGQINICSRAQPIDIIAQGRIITLVLQAFANLRP
jgi:hypothetical protein